MDFPVQGTYRFDGWTSGEVPDREWWRIRDVRSRTTKIAKLRAR